MVMQVPKQYTVIITEVARLPHTPETVHITSCSVLDLLMSEVFDRIMRAVMMKNRRTAWTNIAVITPPASSNALGMFSKPAPNAAFTIKNIEPNVEDPSL